ncbi:MAG: ABC transporter substrate-binding protein [Candidatus Rokubacteria bacterium]|nr:ABC transporter substrate-binding protein [Candidatus Rokubacteria bacterium]
MKRLVCILISAILLSPPTADAQQAGKVYRIGMLWSVSPEFPLGQALLDEFRHGLREHGYTDGQNIALEHRYARGKLDLFPELVAELVRSRVDVIVVPNSTAALAAKQATPTIPIVFATAADPVAQGLVASLARPGGTITGLSLFAGTEIVGKSLQLLKEAVPKVSRVAVLWNPAMVSHALLLKEIEVPARSLGLQLQVLEARGPDAFASAFAAMTRGRTGALFVMADPMFLSNRTRLAELAAKHRLPAIYGLREHVEAGGLMAYAPSLAGLFRLAATYVAKILNGAKPADLPVEQPTRFELVVNLKTARALGLTIPQSVLIRADEVIR